MARAANKFEANTFRIIAWCQNRDDFNVTSVAGTCINVEQPGGLPGALDNCFLKHVCAPPYSPNQARIRLIAARPETTVQ